MSRFDTSMRGFGLTPPKLEGAPLEHLPTFKMKGREMTFMETYTDAMSRANAPRGGSVDKITRYGWEGISSEPGELTFLSPSVLQVDDSYQRELNNAKAVAITKYFNWVAFGVIVVGRRPDGEMFIIDGQHRVAAARKRSDVSMVPCIVFRVNDQVKEADGFIRANVNRKTLTAIDQHKARIQRGDEPNITIEELAKENGLIVQKSSSRGSLKCVSICVKLLDSDRDSFIAMFPLAAQICQEHHFDNRVIEALTFVNAKTKGALERGLWRRAVLDLGYDGIQSAIVKASVFYERGGARVWAKGVVEALNKGRSKNKLNLPE